MVGIKHIKRPTLPIRRRSNGRNTLGSSLIVAFLLGLSLNQYITTEKIQKLDTPEHSIGGAINGAFVRELAQERKYPSFRNKRQSVEVADRHAKISSAFDSSKYRTCEKTGGDDLLCKESNGKASVMVYNGAKFSRLWCGHIIGPNSATQLEVACPERNYNLFQKTPTIDGQGLPPTIIKSHPGPIVKSKLESVQCGIPCFQEKNMAGSDRYIDGNEEWHIIQTMEDVQPPMDRIDYRLDKYFASQSFVSSIPTPKFSFEKHSLRNRPAATFDDADPKAVYILNDSCTRSSTRRHKYFESIAAKLAVDSYGMCHHNKEPPLGSSIQTLSGRLELMKKYRFVLAFDSRQDNDHISEMVWEAFLSGSVPVFVGAKNAAKDHFPPHSAIIASDFPHWDDVAEYVKKLSNDRELWQSYHAWRDDETALTVFEQKYAFTRMSKECRMCKWAYAKKYGLGWNHTTQELQEVKLKRQMCLTSDFNRLAVKPFIEQWVGSTPDKSAEEVIGDDRAPERCSSDRSESNITVGKYQIRRTIEQRDGVTDISINQVNGSVLLRLRFPSVRNRESSFFRNTHSVIPTTNGSSATSITIKDSFSQVTVIADWETVITCPSEGVIDIQVGSTSSPKQIRIITEDADSIHGKPTEFSPSSFMKLMTQDFIDPLSFQIERKQNHSTEMAILGLLLVGTVAFLLLFRNHYFRADKSKK